MAENKKSVDGVNAQFVMSLKARAQLQKFKDRLARNDIRVRVGDVVNLLLEKTTVADFDRISKDLVDTHGAIEKLRKRLDNGQITEEQFNALVENARRRLESEE
ncbi:SHOCT domain-containing protein [Klebsiella pneumoniae]|nr:SHOCT domain-containing protein [Klebsiella pneumoniae]